MILRKDGEIFTCGENRFGELGNETLKDSPIWALVKGLNKAILIKAGYKQSFAKCEDGTIYAWGQGYGAIPKKINWIKKTKGLTEILFSPKGNRIYDLKLLEKTLRFPIADAIHL